MTRSHICRINDLQFVEQRLLRLCAHRRKIFSTASPPFRDVAASLLASSFALGCVWPRDVQQLSCQPNKPKYHYTTPKMSNVFSRECGSFGLLFGVLGKCSCTSSSHFPCLGLVEGRRGHCTESSGEFQLQLNGFNNLFEDNF